MTDTQPSPLDMLKGCSVAFGLKAQGHIPTIERMLAFGKSWREIARQIGWDEATLIEHWEQHMTDTKPHDLHR